MGLSQSIDPGAVQECRWGDREVHIGKKIDTCDLVKDRVNGRSHETPNHPVSEHKFLWEGAKDAKTKGICPGMTIPEVFSDLPEPRRTEPKPAESNPFSITPIRFPRFIPFEAPPLSILPGIPQT